MFREPEDQNSYYLSYCISQQESLKSLLRMHRLGILNSDIIHKIELTLEKLCLALHVRLKDICKTTCLLAAVVLNKIIKNKQTPALPPPMAS